jgi:eukaryotic-like serine/threonine-protein kinase
MKEDPDRELAIFTKALNVPPDERSALIKRLCGADENLRCNVESLLEAHDRVGDFLERPGTEEFGD